MTLNELINELRTNIEVHEKYDTLEVFLPTDVAEEILEELHRLRKLDD